MVIIQGAEPNRLQEKSRIDYRIRLYEYNMLGEVDKMAAWSTAMNARSSDPLKLYEQKALAYDSEEGWENFKTCLGGKRKKRLSRQP